ncbi:CLUMA_CG003423, isoform A [Clunio marinus]|uniref:CLUMA_CG003423, isoform A n=1 Tax=Clunio marinus TaxID=568069 RepID=A0A1J1HP35_9DIPT|nr:CLUMA_CG003423, isoform A [Clunio marinus]
MFCYLDNCDNNLSRFNPKYPDDCIMQHINCVEEEIVKILAHYKALKKKTEESIDAQMRYERKYKKEKEKNEQLLLREKKNNKEKECRKSYPNASALKNNEKSIHETFDVNSSDKNENDDPDFQDNLFKSIKRKTPKFVKEQENLLKKKSPQTPKFDNDKKRVKSDNLKQNKLVFKSTEIEESNVSATVNNVDKDETPEDVNNRKRKSSGWLNAKKLKLKPENPKSKPENLQRPKIKSKKDDQAKTNFGLFQFIVPQRKERKLSLESEDSSRSPITSPVKVNLDVVKEEKPSQKLSSNRSLLSDCDLFHSGDDLSIGSSVEIIEPDESKLVIQVSDCTEYKEELFGKEIEEAVMKQEEYESFADTRSRTKFYGECNDCREFYDEYATKYSAKKANKHIEPCKKTLKGIPQPCKGFLLRKKLAEPPLPKAHSPPRRDHNNLTPDGFWDIPFTPDDPDRTQDGLV